MPVTVAIRIFSRSFIFSFPMASRSPERTVLNGSTFFNYGFALTSAGTRSKQYITCEYIGCSTHSVPSWSKVAMRSAGGTKFVLPESVVVWTKFTMACLAEPSFHEGNGSSARAMLNAKATAPTNAAVRIVFVFIAVFFLYLRLLHFLDVAKLPCLVEQRLFRAIEPEQHLEPAAGFRRHPV